MIPASAIEFDPIAHAYRLNGRPAASVTQVLEGEGLSGCTFWKDEHRQRGTAVHKVAHLMGKWPWQGATIDEVIANSAWQVNGTHPSLIGYGRAVAKFYLDTGFRPSLVEQPVASLRFSICGTLDQYGVMPDGRTRLVDFKSGQPQEAAHVQTSLYAMCLEETLGLHTDERVVVWIKPDGAYKVCLPRLDPSVYVNAGQCAVNLYRWRQQFKMLG